MMSIKPQWVAKILNGEKTIEIRKKFSSDYVGWVYIYVTQNHKHAGWKNRDTLKRDSHDGKPTNHFQLWTDGMVEDKDKLNGKVVARFWCDKVGWFSKEIFGTYEEPFTYNQDDLLKKSCLTEKELDIYLQGKNGKAIHITNLEIFDKPKEISEFYKVGYENSVIATKKYILYSMNREERRKYKTELDLKINNEIAVIKDNYKLTRAPQSWCFVEI